MRVFFAVLVLAAFMPSTVKAREPAVHLAQMARDVTDAVRKQRAARGNRPRPDHRPDQETKR